MKKIMTVVWMMVYILYYLSIPIVTNAQTDIIRKTDEVHSTQEQAVYADGIELLTPHAIVMEASTGTVLLEKNKNERVHPASVTKIMTMLLIFEALERGEISLDTEVVTSAYAKSMGGSQVFLEEGEIQTVETLMKCIIIASGNDAAVAMAERIDGSELAFVERMNTRAAELGMNDTHFVDCCGLTDDDAHYTSAYDVALMSRELLVRYPQVTEYASTWMEDITHTTRQGSSSFTLANTNKLLRACHGCDGLKTGSTSKAKYCLSATAEREGIRMISVVLTSPDSKTRFSEAGRMLDYGFSRCRLYRDEDRLPLPEMRLQGMIDQTVKVSYESDFFWLSTEQKDISEIEKTLVWKEDIKAPLEQGTCIGACVYYLDGEKIGESPIVLQEDARKSGYLDWIHYLWSCWYV